MPCAFCLLSAADSRADDEVEARRVYVPLEDLDAIIARDQRGVLLPKDEFLKLYRDAQKNASPKVKAPIGAVISGATYSARFEGEQLLVEARIKISQLFDSWQVLRLPLEGMSIESAKLDGQPAKLGRTEQELLLLNDSRGEHTLSLELSTPLTAVGADKVTSLGVLSGVASVLKISVPAGKHLQLDGLAVERPAPNDQPATYELAVGGKRTAVSLQLTDRQRERTTDSLIFATSGFGLRVAPGEVTWHAVTTLQVHGTPLDRLVCLVPKTLEITDVDSNGLEAWELSDDPESAESTRITLNYRQPFDGSRRIDFRGVMSVPAGESWRVPTVLIKQVTSHIGRALIQHAPSVRLRAVESVGVRTAAVSDADLKSFGTPGTTDSGQVSLLFDLWKEDFSLSFIAQPKEQDVQASISSIFDLTATGLDLITAATVETSFAPLFELELSLPAEWLVTNVTVNNQRLTWNVRTKEDEPGINHLRVPLPQALRPGQPVKLEVRAHRDPEEWPVDDKPLDVTLPEMRLPQSSVTEGTYVIKADSDLDVIPGDINGLDPSNISVPGARLGFTYQDTRFSGTLKIVRKPSRVAARTLTFARLDKQTLHTHIEADLEILGGGLRTLEVALPESAGKDLRFQLLNSPARIVEQTSRAGENGELIWTLQLDRHFVGKGTLVVTSVTTRGSASFPLPLGEGGRRPGEGTERSTATTTKDQPTSDEDANGTDNASQTQPASLTPALSQGEREKSVPLAIPHLRFLAADRQNGFIAIEAEGDQRLTITAQDANKANLPEVDSIEIPASVAYLPTQRIVAAYRYFAGVPSITLTDERFERLPVPTAICRLASITSVLSPAGEFQHQATFHFTAVGVQSLQARLMVDGLGLRAGQREPSTIDHQPSTVLWAALVDGHPVEVRRAEDAFLIPLRPSDDPAGERSLQLFYRTNVPALRVTGELRQPPPELTVLNGAGVSQPMQVLDQQWELRYPPDLLLTDSQGVFVPDPATPLDRTDWLSNLPKSLSLPSWSNIGRMFGAIVCVFIVIAVIWARQRYGVIVGIILPFVLIGIGIALLIAPAVHSTRKSSRTPSSAVSGLFGQQQQNATNFAQAAKGLAVTEGFVDSTISAPGMAPPTAAEPNAPPMPRAAAMPELQQELSKKMAEESGELKRESKAAKKGFAMKPKDARGLREQMSDSKDDAPKAADDVSRDMDIAFRQGSFSERGGRSELLQEVARQRVGGERGGLLSLTMALESQDGAATKKFRYLGTETAASGIGLDLVYENRAAGWTGRVVWIAALAFLAWLLPSNRRTLKATWAVLGLTLPLALAAIAPLAWQNTLDGIFFGTVAAIGLWLLRAVGEAVVAACPRLKTKSFWTSPLTRGAASLFVLSCLAAHSALAQEPPASKPVPPPANPNPDIPARPTVIYPYDDPKEPLAADRVYLPQPKFAELWNAAHPESRIAQSAPQDGLVAEALVVVKPQKLDGNAEAKPTAIVTARVTLFSFRKYQILLPVPIRLSSLSDAKLDGGPAIVVVRGENGQELPTGPAQPGESADARKPRLYVVLDQPGMHVLDLTSEIPIQQAGPAGQLGLTIDPLPSGKLLFVPGVDNVALRVNGTSHLYRARKGKLDGNAETNYFELPIGNTADLRLAWQPKQAAGAVDAIVQSDSATAVAVEDAGVRITSNWSFKVPRGMINDLSFSLPKELKVRSISGPDVGGWEFGENVDGRVLRVFLRRAVGDQTSLAFELFLETRIADEAVSIQVPVFAPLQMSRDFGVIGLFAAPQFSLKNIATKGLTQINAAQFVVPPLGGTTRPPEGGTTNSAPLSAFRYTQRPFEVSFTAQRRAPESTGLAEHALIVERRKVRMSSRLRWDLKGALRSTVGVQLPAGWLPIDVDAPALQDWNIDPATNVLTIEFAEPRIGVLEVVLQGNIAKEPEDTIAELSVPTLLELSKLVTQAAIWFDPAYEATISSSSTWKASDPEHCSEELRTKLGRPARFVFTSNALAPEILGFDLARAVPKLSADAVSLVTVSDTAIDYSLALQWKIANAAADTFTFTTPDWLAGKLDFQGAGIRQTTSEPAGPDSKRTRWTITLQDPVATRYFLLATATLPPPTTREVGAPTVRFERRKAMEDDANAPAEDAAASSFSPLETQRQYVVMINISSSQLTPVGDVGESVQRDELPIVVDQKLVDQATAVLRVRRARGEGQEAREEDTSPKWSLKSFAAQVGAPASVNIADLTTVIAADGTWRMQCLYTIKNRSRQFLALQLPEKSQALSVFVGDQPSRLVELKRTLNSEISNFKSQTYQLVALPKTSEADLSFQVKLVLSGRLPTGPLPRGLSLKSQEIDLPAPTVVSLSDDKAYGVPVARTLWTVLVPKDWSAKPLNDPTKNNLTEQAGDTATVAYQSAWLQEANDLMRVVEGVNPSSQKMEAWNNLKQLRVQVDNGRSQPQSEEGRKLSEAIEQFKGKQAELEHRVIIDNREGVTNFYVAKDQQQAARANAEQAKGNPNANVFFDQLNSNGETFQRQVVTDNNRSLFLGNSVVIANGEDINGNGVLDPGEDTNGNGVLDLGVVSNSAPDESGIKFKLNTVPEGKRAAAKPETARSGRQPYFGKAVTEEDRASRRKQAVDQVQELNRAVDSEKQVQQQAQQPHDRASSISNSNAPAQQSADFQSLNKLIQEPGKSQSEISGRGRYGIAIGGGGGGMGGSGPATGTPQSTFGVGVNSGSGVVGSPVMSDGDDKNTVMWGRRPGVVNLNGVQGMPALVGRDEMVDGVWMQLGWTQSGGLSLPVELQREGNVLRFSRASGSPRLALAVRPNESGTKGLGIAWAAVWGAIAVWLLRLIAGSSCDSTWRQATGLLSVLGLLGMFFLPSPLSELCFVAFAFAAITLAIGVLRSRRQNVAAS